MFSRCVKNRALHSLFTSSRFVTAVNYSIRPCLSQQHVTRPASQARFSSSKSSVKPNGGRYLLVGFVAGTAVGVSMIASILLISGAATANSEPNADSVLQGFKSTSSLAQISHQVRYDSTPDNLAGARQEFIALLGKERVDQSPGSLSSHSSTDWSPSPTDCLPSMILFPQTTEEVSSIAKICHRRRIPMIPFCGGTSLEGTLAATNSEVYIDFKLMNKIIAIRKDDMDITVQPAVSYVELNELLGKQGLFFPPDPGPGAQIGGMIAQGCSGTNAYRYGTMKDWILGLEIVLADGTIVRTRHRPKKSSSGYDLTRLIVGSEGTLAFVTEASLRVVKAPEDVHVGVAAFPSIQNAVRTVIKTMQAGMQLEAIELLDGYSMWAVNQAGYSDRQWHEMPTLFLKFAGSQDTVQDLTTRFLDLANSEKCASFTLAEDSEESSALWQARKTALWSVLATKPDPDDRFISSDACVPISRLADIMSESQRLADELRLSISFVGHAGDGNIHAAVLYSPADAAKAKHIIKEIQRASIRMEGTVSGEHGLGLNFRDMLPEELGEEAVDLMRRLKWAMDPLLLLNPGKMIRLQEDSPNRGV